MTGVSSVQLADRQVLERNDGAQVCLVTCWRVAALCPARTCTRCYTHVAKHTCYLAPGTCHPRLSAALGTGEGGILVYHQIITKLHKVEHAPARPCSNPCPARFPRLLQ